MISQYPLRIDSVLMDQLKKEANEQKRSLNNLLEVALTEFIDALKDEKEEDAELVKLAEAAQHEETIKVTIEELLK